jgi:hypothetical protein
VNSKSNCRKTNAVSNALLVATLPQHASPIRAAERLGLTTRQVRRLARRYAAAGPVGLISKRFNRRSNDRLNDDLAGGVIKLLRST